jgi:hypothetical protein
MRISQKKDYRYARNVLYTQQSGEASAIENFG